LEISYEDPSDDDSFIREKGVIYVNTLHEAMKQSGVTYRLSEAEKRKLRQQRLIDNIGEYEELEEAYLNWTTMGEMYGFSDKYTPEEQKEIKARHIEEFEKSKHPWSPSKRMYKLRDKPSFELQQKINRLLRES